MGASSLSKNGPDHVAPKQLEALDINPPWPGHLFRLWQKLPADRPASDFDSVALH